MLLGINDRKMFNKQEVLPINKETKYTANTLY